MLESKTNCNFSPILTTPNTQNHRTSEQCICLHQTAKGVGKEELVLSGTLPGGARVLMDREGKAARS